MISSKLQKYQLLIFSTLFIGYGIYSLNRRSVSLSMPSLISNGLGKNEAGLIASSQNLAYAISKFIGGVLSDKISSKLLFAGGLIGSGLATIGFANSESSLLFVIFWFFNGLAQGAGWPACAKLLRKWYSPTSFGTWWSLLSASANISGALSPFLATLIISSYGWNVFVYFSGIISIIFGFVALITIVNSPNEIGLENFIKKEDKVSTESKSDETVWDLMKSPLLWIVTFSYMSVFCSKTSASDWGQIFLLQDCGKTKYTASSFTSSLETGGFVGGVLAGYLTDLILRFQSSSSSKSSNHRIPAAIFFMIGVMISFHLMYFNFSYETSQIMIAVIGFILGACLYGPIALFGIIATESAPSHLSGTSHAIVALAANVGAIISGLPFSILAQRYSWRSIYLLLEILTGITIIIMLLYRQVPSTIMHKKEKKVKIH